MTTPNFALDLSEDGIELLHRAADQEGWYVEGRVDFAADDIAEGLASFRDRALELEGDEFTTKLILPKSQLLYTSVPVGKDVAATLEERTPYRIDQLSYDTSQDGQEIKIVAVALETLGEAEGFIGPHGLNPVGFTAKPDAGAFIGEPMLGGMLDGKGGFDVDAHPVQVIAKPTPPVESEQKAATHSPTVELEDTDGVSNIFAETPPEQPEAGSKHQPDPVALTNASKSDAPLDTKDKTPSASPAAFSSRRPDGEEGDAKASGEHVRKLSSRIAVANNAPKLGGAADLPSSKGKTSPKENGSETAKPAAKVKRAATTKAKTAPIIPPAPQAAPKAVAPAALAAELAKERDPLERIAAHERRGKPRFLGLIMTAILLVCLALAALLSSYVLPDDAVSRFFGEKDAADIELATVPVAPALIEEPMIALPIQEDVEDVRLPIEDVPPVFENVLTEIAPQTDVSTPILPEPTPTPPVEMTELQAETAYAVSGIWQRADTLSLKTQAPESLDKVYIASLDPTPAFEDPPALLAGSANSAEVELTSFTRPPPPGVIFDIDERGLVRATPEGAINPDGVTVFLGQPPLVPLRRASEAIEATPEPEALAQTDISAPPAPTAEQLRLSSIRPVQRPTAPQEQNERATSDDFSRSELARVRPQQRPVSAQARAQAIAQALLEVERAEAESIEATLTSATPLAVASSRRAQQRPRDFAAIVRTARATPQAAPSQAAQTASASTASAAVQATGPAVVRSSRANPTGPVSGRVAAAATQGDAIALGNVALVGVFGTSANRRALIRTPNGRFKRVAIGDRVDGGRVAAIDSNSLRYSKGGRTITLQMPSS